MSDTEADIKSLIEKFKEMTDMKFESDSITGLSATDKTNLIRTFYIFNEHGAKNIERVLVSFYTKYPQHLQYFKYFKGKSPGDLHGNPHFTLLATAIMGALSSMMMSLDRPERMQDIGKNVGRFHGHRGINPAAFDDMKGPFKEVLADVLKGEWNAVSGVWSKALDVVMATVVSGLK